MNKIHGNRKLIAILSLALWAGLGIAGCGENPGQDEGRSFEIDREYRRGPDKLRGYSLIAVQWDPFRFSQPGRPSFAPEPNFLADARAPETAGPGRH